MKVHIEHYRGFEIRFDTDKETFGCFSDDFDYQASKKSYASIKKHIDEYIKENSDFKPFFIESILGWHRGYEKIKVIGIRKDGVFVYEDKEGQKQQLSKYDEKNYTLIDPDNESVRAEYNALLKEREIIDQKMKVVKDKFIVLALDAKRKLYL